MKMQDVRKYFGIYTGKMVKPEPDQDTSGFKKGDRVYVLRVDDYKKHLEALDIIMHGSMDELRELSRKMEGQESGLKD